MQCFLDIWTAGVAMISMEYDTIMYLLQ